jgi:hypothetical protein
MREYKKKRIVEEAKLPQFRCSYCTKIIQLTFNPRDRNGGIERWSNFICPNCHHANAIDGDGAPERRTIVS